MVTKLEAIRSVKEYTDQFSKTQIRHRGFLGDGDGTVYVADREGYVYVRHRAASQASITGDIEPEEVLYSRADIPPIEGYPVIFGEDLDTENFQLLAHDNDQLLGWIFDNYIKDHHEQHEFDEYDTVWIQKQALLPLLVHPTSPASTTIQVYRGWYQWDNSWHYFETTTSAELSGYIPPNLGEARFLLICIDGETETLHYEPGDIFPQFLPPVDCEDRIPPPPEGKIPSAALYLVGGTTSFDWDIIYDVRLLFSGGGPMSVGGAPRDASYVTLSYNATLSAERVLTAGHGIIVTDNGVNSTVVIAVNVAADYNWSGDHNFNAGEMGLPSGTSFPVSPQQSDLFYRTDQNILYVYNGSAWVELGVGGGEGNQVFRCDGALITAQNVNEAYIVTSDASISAEISAVYIHCGTPGGAGTTIVDVNKNGVTIFTVQGNRPQLAWNDPDGVAKSGVPDVASIAENDVLTVDIDQIATGAKDLSVIIVISTGGGGGAPTDAKYVVTEESGSLSAEIVLPQLGNYSPDTPPAAAGAYDDEFDDDVIAVAWVFSGAYDAAFDLMQSDGSLHASESVYHGFLLLQGDHTVTRAFTPDLTADSWTLITKLSLGYDADLNESWWRFRVLEDATHYYSVRIGRKDAAIQVRTVYDNGGGATEGDMITVGYGTTVYVMITKDTGTNFSSFISTDGLCWIPIEIDQDLNAWTSLAELEYYWPGTGETDGMLAIDFLRYFTTEAQYKIGKDV